jgi:hypothetical protein
MPASKTKIETQKAPKPRPALLIGFLVALVLLAIALGPRVYRAVGQRQAIAALRTGHDISVAYSFQLDDKLEPILGAPLPGADWLRNWLGLDFFDTVVGATVVGADDRPVQK